jgi:hypothetical protein
MATAPMLDAASRPPLLHRGDDLLAGPGSPVTAGPTLPHRSAAAEGNFTKVKMTRRQTYGRANFALLRVMLHLG